MSPANEPMTATTTAAIPLSADALTTPEEKPWQITVRRFRRHRMAMLSVGIVAVIFLVSLFARQLTSFGPSDLAVGHYFLSFGTADEPTGRIHYLGTDNIGRDYFTRLVYAGRISLSVAFISVAISTLLGVTVGAYAGYYGGWVDSGLMRVVEFLLTIPALPLLLIISSILLRNENALPIPSVVLVAMGKIMLLDPRDARQALVIIIVLAGLGWLTTARLMRGMVLALREQPFVEAARAMAASNAYIIFRHMVPNSLAPVIVQASLDMAGFLVAEAALSFLGFGIQDPIPTWGNMLSATQQFMFDRPWLPLVPGTPIFLCSLAFNFIGDGLRDALDPRLKM
jgi:peptide/nickel transport system permease protein